MNWKKRVGIIALVGVMICGTVGCNTTKNDAKEVKNVIFMIGDGMGYNAIDAAGTLYKKELKNETLSMKSLPVHGTSITYSMSNQITDSAAGGTALSTGYKTGNKIVAKSMDKSTDYKTTLELAAEKGKSTGIVVTTPVVDGIFIREMRKNFSHLLCTSERLWISMVSLRLSHTSMSGTLQQKVPGLWKSIH